MVVDAPGRAPALPNRNRKADTINRCDIQVKQKLPKEWHNGGQGCRIEVVNGFSPRTDSDETDTNTAMRAPRTEFKDLQQMAIAVHSRSDESDKDSDE